MIKINTVIITEKHTQTQHFDTNEDNRFLEFIKDNEPLKKLRLKICCTAFLLVVISESERLSRGIQCYFSLRWKGPAKVHKKSFHRVDALRKNIIVWKPEHYSYINY